MQFREALLVFVVALAFMTEAAVGFGATVVTVALGALLLPLDVLLPAFVPVNMCLSTYLVSRNFRHVDARMLFFKIVPAMGVGLPFGIWAAARLPSSLLQFCFAIFVLVLSSIEQLRLWRAEGPSRPVSGGVATALLFLGGLVHGAFATGGPPAVYVCGRTLHDKRTFRSTLSALWLLMNGALAAVYLRGGRIDGASLRRSALLVPGLLFGAWVGELLHGRISERSFRIALFSLLTVAAIVLAIRA